MNFLTKVDKETVVLALHGFLGEPADFEKVSDDLPRGITFVPVDYTLIPSLTSEVLLKDWGARFNSWATDFLNQKFKNHRKILLGYSQGGRLALHALKEDSSLWDQVVIVSASPGIQDSEKPKRKLSDRNWSLKFLSDDFQAVVKEWNSQNVFKGGTKEPERREDQYSRKVLADSLENWSISEQENLRPFIAKMKNPILWVAGNKDQKYASIAEEMAILNPNIKVAIIPGSSHRVLFDQPKHLAALLR